MNTASPTYNSYSANALGKFFWYSLAAHILLAIGLIATSALRRPQKPPEKVYSVKIVPQRQKANTTPIIPKKEPETKAEKKKTTVIPKKKKKVTKTSKPSSPKKEPKEETHQVSKGNASVRVDGTDFRNDFYLNLIITKIAKFWRNPLRRGGRKISAIIYFRIHRDGSVSDITLEKRSGNTLFDTAALRATNSAAPLPPLPDTYTGDFIGVHFEFEHRP